MIRTGEDEVRQGLTGHLARLWRFGMVLSRRRETAEDLVQATCLRALERSHQFQPGTRLDSWLFAILNSIWLNEVRARHMREHAALDGDRGEAPRDRAAAIEDKVFARQVLREVDALPQSQRAAVFLVYVEGFTYREAAELLETPIGTIMSRLAAARAKLARLDPRRTDTPEARRR